MVGTEFRGYTWAVSHSDHEIVEIAMLISAAQYGALERLAALENATVAEIVRKMIAHEIGTGPVAVRDAAGYE